MESGEATSPLDRTLQRELLMQMQAVYPNAIPRLASYAKDPGRERIEANLLYLEAHGLCEAGLSANQSGGFESFGACITARGLDFLADDGGLSAILGIVTIKLDGDSIRGLLAAKVDAANISEQEKGAFKKHLASLSGTVLRAATNDLIHQGLAHLPDAERWLRTLLGL